MCIPSVSFSWLVVLSRHYVEKEMWEGHLNSSPDLNRKASSFSLSSVILAIVVWVDFFFHQVEELPSLFLIYWRLLFGVLNHE